MNKPLPGNLLDKYLNGTCSAMEEELVLAWYKSYDKEADHISGLSEAEQLALEEKIYDAILQKIAYRQPIVEAQVIELNKPKLPWYKIGAAAAVITIAVTAGIFYTKSNTTPAPHTASAETVEYILIANNSNHIYKSVLPDSSTVWVNPHATLKYPSVFDKAARMVSMTGECFFEVTKNPKRPFIITSNNIITKVWGTSFFVRDNDIDKAASVSVVTGKVSVSVKSKTSTNNIAQLNKGEVILYLKQKAVFSRATKALQMQSNKPDAELQIWKHANLVFDNKALRDIVPQLNATYNVNIKVADDKLNRFMLNADLTGLNLPDVLDALSKALNIDYSFINNTIVLNQPINYRKN
ncbi:FecR family protein [Mucilaginibacter pallidiroseus]|uniref:FecR family protein n=1 Tax=Mucilaginibacter pallidiroseus TaxID=2599295 RepID=A0A563UC71_9SPHI|nr:FecR family protein [Mucilaginibacter pallidiroseus]TWR28934.1 FecR family protein [Mucilaginibacter pallidiroseus]